MQGNTVLNHRIQKLLQIACCKQWEFPRGTHSEGFYLAERLFWSTSDKSFQCRWFCIPFALLGSNQFCWVNPSLSWIPHTFPLDAARSGLDSGSAEGREVLQGSVIFFWCLCTVFFACLGFAVNAVMEMKTSVSLIGMRKSGMQLKVDFSFCLRKMMWLMPWSSSAS